MQILFVNCSRLIKEQITRIMYPYYFTIKYLAELPLQNDCQVTVVFGNDRSTNVTVGHTRVLYEDLDCNVDKLFSKLIQIEKLDHVFSLNAFAAYSKLLGDDRNSSFDVQATN